MLAKWQTVRVFISSTFPDMHAERDHLTKRVFPAHNGRTWAGTYANHVCIFTLEEVGENSNGTA